MILRMRIFRQFRVVDLSLRQKYPSIKCCCTKKPLSHTPVLVNEVLSFFQCSDLRVFLDCTLGAGGHTFEILQQHPELECFVGVDLDSTALHYAQERLHQILQQRPGLNAHFVEGNFSDLARLFVAHNPPLGHLLNEGIDGVLLDLGMSSLQLDNPERGFSFMNDGPLDMRMGHSLQITAEEIINTWSEFELSALFRDYGEERRWRQIARQYNDQRIFVSDLLFGLLTRICEAREEKIIKSTRQLVEIIGKSTTRQRFMKKPIHPATRVFQALRIAVNDELRSLERILPLLIESLRNDGVCAVISFHSLEDRLVKKAFKEATTAATTTFMDLESANFDNNQYPSNNIHGNDTTANERKISGRILTKRPITTTAEEAERNPRSRSAKLRIFQKSVNR